MSKPSVYIETTIPSYLTARSSGDIVTAAKQQLTREWWEQRRLAYHLTISAAVEDEARQGDPLYAKARLVALSGIALLDITSETLALAKDLARKMSLPRAKQTDALHIAVAAVHEIDFLLTWNCTHINNAMILPKVEALCELAGFRCPVICTPQELT